MNRELGDYIQDTIDAMDRAMKFIKDLSYNEFVQDDKTVYATTRALEIIGEAVKNIPNGVRERYPEVPWKDMTGMRDRIIHGYFEVDLEIIWATIKEELPPLKPIFEKILKDIEK